jgi:hypothetical protein
MDTFEFINNCYSKKRNTTSTEKQLQDTDSYYMVCRWLSMTPSGLMPAYKTSRRISKLPRWVVGCLIYNFVTKNKPPVLKYIKKGKTEKTNEELLQKVKEHFHCSMTHAKQIISIFENKEVSLNKSFGIKE